MSSYLGKNLHVSIFGQSHAPAIGVTVDGLPAGERVDLEELDRFLQRRPRAGTPPPPPRKEADKPRFLCGLVDNVTCGAPLAAVIENTNTRSKDYSSLHDVPRPGHADYTAQVRYGGFQDVAGGGHFSGRLTAPCASPGASPFRSWPAGALRSPPTFRRYPRWRTGPLTPWGSAGRPLNS